MIGVGLPPRHELPALTFAKAGVASTRSRLLDVELPATSMRLVVYRP
jgi:hypothetical protein